MLGSLRQGWHLKSVWLDPGSARTAQPAFPPQAALEMRSRDLPSFQGGWPRSFRPIQTTNDGAPGRLHLGTGDTTVHNLPGTRAKSSQWIPMNAHVARWNSGFAPNCRVSNRAPGRQIPGFRLCGRPSGNYRSIDIPAHLRRGRRCTFPRTAGGRIPLHSLAA